MNKLIINGIDVSECDYINCCSEEAKCMILQDDICSNSQYCKSEPDCYFKRTKRLEQENERLQMLSCANCGEKYLSPDGAELYEKNVQLQEENEKLKKRQITKNGFICDCEQNAKYKQALEEIREIISGNYEILDPQAKQDIKKLINEVLNDRD